MAGVVAEAAHVFEHLGHTVELVKGGPPETGRDWGLVNVFDMAARLELRTTVTVRRQPSEMQ